jgi:hypothetical protein
MGVVGLLCLDGWGRVYVGDQVVMCVVACCEGGRWGAVGWMGMVMMVMAWVFVGSGWGRDVLFDLCLDMPVGCRG